MFFSSDSSQIPREQRLIVGLGVFGHDTGIALVRNGQVLFAAEQERFDRKKHSRAIPMDALEAGLRFIGADARDITDVATNFEPFRLILNYFRHIWNYLPRSLRMLVDDRRYRNVLKMGTYKTVLYDRLGISPSQIAWHHIPHHVAHAASAFFSSPFERSAVLTSDALGEFDSVLKGLGKGNQIQVLERIPYPHSMGAVFSAITDHLGFEIFSGEGKVMGLAGYGSLGHDRTLRNLVDLEPSGGFSINDRMFSYHIKPWVHTNWTSPAFERIFGPRREKSEPITDIHTSLARELQDLADRVLVHVCQDLHRKTREDSLCYAGGVALNGYSNTRILQETGFKNLYIQPAANDGGTSLGAALYCSHAILGTPRTPAEGQVFLGPSFSSSDCEKALKKHKLAYTSPENFPAILAQHLWENRILGWFQGRMEIGPRALGHRSILANPCWPAMKDHLNLRVKHREPFRPFAPVVPTEWADTYFDMPCRKSPYMLLIVNVKPEWREKLPAITHVDGTARVQTLDREQNPALYKLLMEFRKLSGIPMLLNTSFNGPEEPIVCTPGDAIRSFMRHGLDDLALESFIVSK